MRIFFYMPDGAVRSPKAEPTEIKLKRSCASPADELYVSFETDIGLFAETPTFVRAEHGGRVVFDGIVDEHKVKRQSGVRTESFSCRSRAALLEDNEAMPGVLQMPSLRLLERLYLKPFGLKGDGGDNSPQRGRMVVETRTSCWEVLCKFSKRFLGCTPRCMPDGTVSFAIDNAKKLTLPEPLSLTVTDRQSKLISHVIMQSAASGAYNTVYESGSRIPRVRYVSSASGITPKEVFSEGLQAALSAEAVLDGFTDAVPGDLASLESFDGRCERMRTRSVNYTFENGRIETRMLFEADR